MSDNIHLNADPRSDSGKGASRRLRRQNQVPAIVYGGKDGPVSISLNHNEFSHELENEAIYTQLIDLQIGSKTTEVILRDLQRHPYKAIILHADFFRVDAKVELHVTVPIHVNNAEECVGVKMDGGMLTQIVSEIEILALPKNLPEYLEVDALELHLGDSLHLSDIPLPEGVQIVALAHAEQVEEGEHDDHDIGILSVVKMRAVEEISDEAPEAPASEDDDAEESDDSDDGKDKSGE